MKPTSAQSFVIHTLISLFIGALLAGFISLIQIIGSSNGVADWRIVLAAGVTAFLAWFGKGLLPLEQNPQTLVAVMDTLGELKASHINLSGLIGQLLQQQQSQPVTPPAPRDTLPTQPVQAFPVSTPPTQQGG